MIDKLKSFLGIGDQKKGSKSTSNPSQNISEIRVQTKATMSVIDARVDALNLDYSNALKEASIIKKRKDERNLSLIVNKLKRIKMQINDLVNSRAYLSNAIDQIEVDQSNEEILDVLTTLKNTVNNNNNLQKSYVTNTKLQREKDALDVQQEIRDSIYEKNSNMSKQLDMSDPESLAILDEIDEFENANKKTKKVSQKETEEIEAQDFEDELEAKIKKLKKMIDKG